MKKYFVKLCDHCDPNDPEFRVVREVTHDEYVRMANQQFFARDAETMERIMENATKESGVCGTKHLFWTEGEV
jgi:hypothetical protein